jgi:hypothetical protein
VSRSYKEEKLSPTPLADGACWEFLRVFHVETFRGGMNRLLLRSWASDAHPTRLEVLFMNAKYICIPMSFDGLTIRDSTVELGPTDPIVVASTGLKVFEIASGETVGRIVAGSVAFAEDSGSPSDPSSFFMM